MTFNIWESGINVFDGLRKIAKHIAAVDADIVALQEVEDQSIIRNLTILLGSPWHGIAPNFSYPDSGILARHQIINDSVSHTSRGIGARIFLKELNRTIHFWSFHLDYRSYGPYAANNKMVTDRAQIMAGEMNWNGNGRFENMREIILNDSFQKSVNNSVKEPLIVCGDFNSPSHLDWTDDTKGIHGGWSFEWPATKMLQGEAQMVDSFRHLHRNSLRDPGTTWSTVEKTTSQGWGWSIPEPQDRIDFIFYRSPFLEPIESFTYQGNEMVWPKPFHWYNDYPSDHFAVITSFLIA